MHCAYILTNHNGVAICSHSFPSFVVLCTCYVPAPLGCCMQVAPATQSSKVGAQNTQQHLQPQIGTAPLLGIAPRPNLPRKWHQTPCKAGSSVSPIPCQCSLGHPAHPPETDDGPQAKRLRYQDPPPAPNGLSGVAQVSLALQPVSPAHYYWLAAVQHKFVSCPCILHSHLCHDVVVSKH